MKIGEKSSSALQHPGELFIRGLIGNALILFKLKKFTVYTESLQNTNSLYDDIINGGPLVQVKT